MSNKTMPLDKELIDFYNVDDYPDIIQEDYGWPSRSKAGAKPFLSKVKASHIWRNLKVDDVPALIGEAIDSLSDMDAGMVFIVTLNSAAKSVDLTFENKDFFLAPLHAAGSPNLPFALRYYMGKEESFKLFVTRDGVFWLNA